MAEAAQGPRRALPPPGRGPRFDPVDSEKREKQEKEETGSVESIRGGEIEEEDPVNKPDDPMNKNQKNEA
ncbi:hypothetical protein C1H46_015461 [Malus baccata]|uniref:Uncharacterized protein n=1 Tax=Malus baccata TaxID=106549 RepID=A0A540MJ57_MALBA|nr:hypothetical protein C1H46_015461 [Malus baccata]